MITSNTSNTSNTPDRRYRFYIIPDGPIELPSSYVVVKVDEKERVVVGDPKKRGMMDPKKYEPRCYTCFCGLKIYDYSEIGGHLSDRHGIVPIRVEFRRGIKRGERDHRNEQK